jgi:hypothetical protein
MPGIAVLVIGLTSGRWLEVPGVRGALGGFGKELALLHLANCFGQGEFSHRLTSTFEEGAL